MENRKIKILIGLIGLICLIRPISSLAEEPVLPTTDQISETALTIMPSIHEGVISPGKTTSQVFEIKNSSYFPLPIKCYINTFDASDETGGVAISDENDAKRSPASWISIVEPDFVLQSETTRKVTVNFSPPSDLTPGGYYAIFFAEPLLPESFLDSSSLRIGGRLGSLLFMISPGDLNEKGSIASVNLPRYIFNGSQPELKIRFQNEGNVHLRPSGKVTVTNRLTKKSQTLTVSEFTVLPGKIRQQIVLLGEIKWPGAYRATLQLDYGRDTITVNKTMTFYYLPVIPIIVTIAVIGLVVLLLIGKTRKRIFKAIQVVIKG